MKYNCNAVKAADSAYDFKVVDEKTIVDEVVDFSINIVDGDDTVVDVNVDSAKLLLMMNMQRLF